MMPYFDFILRVEANTILNDEEWSMLPGKSLETGKALTIDMKNIREGYISEV